MTAVSGAIQHLLSLLQDMFDKELASRVDLASLSDQHNLVISAQALAAKAGFRRKAIELISEGGDPKVLHAKFVGVCILAVDTVLIETSKIMKTLADKASEPAEKSRMVH